MLRFRKKPAVISAWPFMIAEQRDENIVLRIAMPPWLSEVIEAGDVWLQGGDQPYMTIKTVEGEMRADLGDWIIQGVQGELCPCKPDIFEATYEQVEPPIPPAVDTTKWRQKPL